MAMAFSVFVEVLDMKLRKPSAEPIKIHEPYPIIRAFLQ